MQAIPVPTWPERSALGWHSGERAVMELLGVTTFQRPNPTSLVFPVAHGERIADNELLAIGTLDERGRPWTTIWGGQKGFAQRTAQGILGIRTLVDLQYDPVVQALLSTAHDVKNKSRQISGISIDFESRDRVKVMGRLLTAELDGNDVEAYAKSKGNLQLSMLVQESTGNCPKYINRREVQTHVPSPWLVSESLPLHQHALDLIHRADCFFISSSNGDSMDSNHRGGPSGFMRVASNKPEDLGGVVLVYPEYSGNRLYQTLGNLYLNPRVGIAVPDFETSDVLYLTGAAELLLGSAATEVLPHCKLAVRIHVHMARLVADGLPFRSGPVYEMSPYDPPVRVLAEEPGALADAASATAVATAELLKRETITPTISRFTFALHPSTSVMVRSWSAGQHVTLDFSGELDTGYKHMNAENPQSLNDDYVRTFTVTNLPPAISGSDIKGDDIVVEGTPMELTVRKHGPVTTFLWGYDLETNRLTIPVMGFGGEESFQLLPASTSSRKRHDKQQKAVFIAAGVGITPLLSQAPGVLAAQGSGPTSQDVLLLLWTLRASDLPLAVNTFAEIPNLAKRTRLFVTGLDEVGRTDPVAIKSENTTSLLNKVCAAGAEVVRRRIKKDDVLLPVQWASSAGRPTKFFICTGTELSKALLVWLAGQTVVTENFAY